LERKIGAGGHGLSTTIACTFMMITLMVMTACGSGNSTATKATTNSSLIPKLKAIPSLHNMLPVSNKKSGKLIFDTVPNPPWAIVGPDGNVDSGVDVDLGNALAQVLGLKLHTVLVGDAATLLAGISAGRYDTFLGPLGITPQRKQTLYELIWVTNTFYFEVQKTSPIHAVGDLCGRNVAVLTGTIGATIVVPGASQGNCLAQGKPAITMVSFATDPEAQLAVKAGRVDAYALSDASCVYSVKQPGASTLRCVVPKPTDHIAVNKAALAVSNQNPQLLNALKAALEELYRQGVYQKIMAKWGLGQDMVTEFVLG
jgi:polar amino acid transport system substrate-binding protein